MPNTSRLCMITILFAMASIASLISQASVGPSINIPASPIIQSYSKTDFSGGAQSWDTDLLPSGQILVANDQGVLIFDGSRWQKYGLPNGSIVRSVLVHGNKIFVGGQDEIGYLSPDTSGILTFTSIRDRFPDQYLPLQDIWEILADGQFVHFRSMNRVYCYDISADTSSVTDPLHPIISLHDIGGEIYYADLYRGLISISDTSQVFAKSERLAYLPLIEILVTATDTLYLMEKDGIVMIKKQNLQPVDRESDEFFRRHNIFCAARINDQLIAVGTSFGGIAIIGNDGKISQVISQNDGLSSNNIHTLTIDNHGDLWAGTSTGIDQIRLSSPAGLLQPDGTDNGSYYAIEHHKGKMYYGTNNGLYEAPTTGSMSEKQASATKVPQSEGQVWGLNIIDGDLLMGHNTGAYQIIEGRPILISRDPGAWVFEPAAMTSDMYVGTYNGIDLYQKEGSRWIFKKKLEGFMESSRFVVNVTPNEVWVSHPYRGIYKITHDDSYFVLRVDHYDANKGLTSDLGNHIFSIAGKVYVTANDGIHIYDASADEFVIDPVLNASIPDSDNVRRLYEDLSGNIWYLTDVELGMIDNSAVERDRIVFPELAAQFVNGFEKITFIDTTQALIAGYEKVIKLNTQIQIRTALDNPPLITSVHLMGQRDSIIFGGFCLLEDTILSRQSDEQIPELTYEQNELLFTYSSGAHSPSMLYSLSLLPKRQTPRDNDWSLWTNSTSKEYNNLPPDTYTLHLRSKTSLGTIGGPTSYTFEINPPWYLSAKAIMAYYLLGLGSIVALIFIPRTQHKKEKEALTEAIEVSDAKVEEIQNQKLRAEIEHKNSELASSTLHLVQKNETIDKIRKEVQSVSKNLQDPQARKEVRKILSVLSDDERLEDEWDNFSFRFDQVHTDFLKRIAIDFPQLTPKDKKLCAYLRMNLTTKEIAPLLNISVRGVEISRYRLRKKIELDKSVNLTDYMMNY